MTKSRGMNNKRRLTRLEAEAIGCVIAGMTVAEAGTALNRGPPSIVAPLRRAREKLGARTVARAAVLWDRLTAVGTVPDPAIPVAPDSILRPEPADAGRFRE